MQTLQQKTQLPVKQRNPIKSIVPKPIKWTSRVTKAILTHLDGQQSEIKLLAPIYTTNGEAQELSNTYLSSYIESLTSHFIQIVSYQIQLGSVDSTGKEHYNIKYEEQFIPLGKVYRNGDWLDPVTEIEKLKNKTRFNRYPNHQK